MKMKSMSIGKIQNVLDIFVLYGIMWVSMYVFVYIIIDMYATSLISRKGNECNFLQRGAAELPKVKRIAAIYLLKKLVYYILSNKL